MLNDREKLIELIKESRDICRGRDYEACKECSGYGKGLGCITLLTADHLIANNVVVRKRAKWDDSGRYQFMDGTKAIRCTECGCALTEKEYAANHWNFCPVCGADMRGTEHETD